MHATLQMIMITLSKLAEISCKRTGNFTDEKYFLRQLINLLKSNDLESDFSEEIHNLYDYRKKRTNLHLDDKILLSWNSLMIAALSMFYRVSRNEKYLNAVVNAQKFIEENMCDGVQLFTSWRDGKHSEKSFLDDYAFYIASLIELYN